MFKNCTQNKLARRKICVNCVVYNKEFHLFFCCLSKYVYIIKDLKQFFLCENIVVWFVVYLANSILS